MTIHEHWLIIDTDSYAGNFERELAGFVFGIYNEYGEHEAKLLMEQWTPKEAKDVELWSGEGNTESILEPFPHDEYGIVWETIELDQDGKYNSVIVKLQDGCWTEYITNEVLEKVKQRAERFCELRNTTPDRYTFKAPNPANHVHFLGLRHKEIASVFEDL